jgi:hypothetical protein
MMLLKQNSAREPALQPQLRFWDRAKDKLENAGRRANDHLLLTRPYSDAEYLMTTITTKAIEKGPQFSLEPSDGLKSLAIFSLWAGLCWLLEASHKHEFRPKISKKAANAAYAIGAGIAAFFNPSTIAFSALHYLSSVAYSKKEGKSWLLGAYSFFVRGAAQASVFAISQLLYSPALNLRHYALAAAVGAMTAARNLIGDLRDVKYDEKTFAVLYGRTPSDCVVAGLQLSAAALIAVAASPLASLPLVAQASLQFVCKNANKMHRLAVFSSSLTLGIIAAVMGGMEAAIVAGTVLAASAALNVFSYMKVPRRSNVDYSDGELAKHE